MYFCILTWAAQSVNAMTPDPDSGVWRQATKVGSSPNFPKLISQLWGIPQPQYFVTSLLEPHQTHFWKHYIYHKEDTKVQGSHRVWKTWKNKIFWKSHGKSWNFEKSSKVMEKSWNFENPIPINHSFPGIRNFTLMSFASSPVSFIQSNTSEYKL